MRSFWKRLTRWFRPKYIIREPVSRWPKIDERNTLQKFRKIVGTGTRNG